jgi:hypothetical protein
MASPGFPPYFLKYENRTELEVDFGRPDHGDIPGVRFFPERNVTMNMINAKGPVGILRLGLGVAFLSTMLGCVGYVDGGYGGYVGPDVVVAPDPGVVFWGGGGGWDRGHDAHAFSHRGSVSRGIAHGGGGGVRRH